MQLISLDFVCTNEHIYSFNEIVLILHNIYETNAVHCTRMELNGDG